VRAVLQSRCGGAIAGSVDHIVVASCAVVAADSNVLLTREAKGGE